MPFHNCIVSSFHSIDMQQLQGRWGFGGGGQIDFQAERDPPFTKIALENRHVPAFLFRLLTLYQLTLTLVTCFNFSREFLYLVHLKRVLLPEFTIPLAA